MKRRIRRDEKEENSKKNSSKNYKKDKTKKLESMVTPGYTLILTPTGSKKALPPRKPPQHKIKVFFLKQRFFRN